MLRRILYSPDPLAGGGGANHNNNAAQQPSRGTGNEAGGAGAGGQPEGSGQPAPVPYDRFQQVVAERNKHKQDLDALTAREREWTEQQKKIESERDHARGAELRTRVAATSGLPLEFADRLVGGTEDELRADAARLQQFLKPITGPGVPPPPAGGQPARIDLSNMTPAQIREKKADVLRQARGG